MSLEYSECNSSLCLHVIEAVNIHALPANNIQAIIQISLSNKEIEKKLKHVLDLLRDGKSPNLTIDRKLKFEIIFAHLKTSILKVSPLK